MTLLPQQAHEILLPADHSVPQDSHDCAAAHKLVLVGLHKFARIVHIYAQAVNENPGLIRPGTCAASLFQGVDEIRAARFADFRPDGPAVAQRVTQFQRIQGLGEADAVADVEAG